MSLSWLMTGLAAAGGACLLLSLALTPIARLIAARIGFVDRPAGGSHKSHRAPIPYGGGVAIFLSAWVPLVAALLLAVVLPEKWIADNFGELVRALVGGLKEHMTQAVVILGGGAVLHLLGLIDDRKPLGPYAKLLSMIGVALAVSTFGDVRIAEFAGDGVSITLSVIWIVVITNSLNFLDNMDGLSAGVTAICTAFLMICGVMAGQLLVPALAAVFLGAVLGFLVFNFPPAKIFMGDAGSLICGYMLAVISILTTYWSSGNEPQPHALAMPLIILAIPLYDFTSVVIIRLLEGRNPLRGDQRHFSHRLVDLGLSRRFAVLTIYLATATTGLAATLLPGANLRETITLLAIVLMVLGIVAILEMPLRKDA